MCHCLPISTLYFGTVAVFFCRCSALLIHLNACQTDFFQQCKENAPSLSTTRTKAIVFAISSIDVERETQQIATERTIPTEGCYI